MAAEIVFSGRVQSVDAVSTSVTNALTATTGGTTIFGPGADGPQLVTSHHEVSDFPIG